MQCMLMAHGCLLNEVLTQESHRHFDGYGKVAHSGYHIFDMVWQLYEAGLVDKKRPDHLEIFSSSLSPAGLSIDLNEKDYQKYFGHTYESTGYSEKEYRNTVKNYGEMDSFSTIRLLKNTENICNISINLLHSSFSRRSWAMPNMDRYKGNGRVKHQQFTIQQGPFNVFKFIIINQKDYMTSIIQMSLISEEIIILMYMCFETAVCLEHGNTIF